MAVASTRDDVLMSADIHGVAGRDPPDIVVIRKPAHIGFANATRRARTGPRRLRGLHAGADE